MNARTRRVDPHTLALHWNTAYPVGVAVDLREDSGSVTRTTTRSAAWVMGDHSAVVMVEGKSGGYDLTRITAVQS
jgi:hypothetical protein